MSSLLQNSLKTVALTLLCGGALLATAGNAAAEVTFKGKTIDVIMSALITGGSFYQLENTGNIPMRTSDSRVIQNAYETYKAELDRVPIPSDKAIQNTLELSQRVAPKLVTIDIKRHLYFDPVRRLATNGFIDALYNK